MCQAQTVLKEYLEIGAVKHIPPEKAKFLVPWFVISKMEGQQEKLRLISDCRLINEHSDAKKFKMDHWGSIFSLLRRGMWGKRLT